MDAPVVECHVVSFQHNGVTGHHAITVVSEHGPLDAVLSEDGMWLDADTLEELEPAVQRGIAVALEDADLI